MNWGNEARRGLLFSVATQTEFPGVEGFSPRNLGIRPSAVDSAIGCPREVLGRLGLQVKAGAGAPCVPPQSCEANRPEFLDIACVEFKTICCERRVAEIRFSANFSQKAGHGSLSKILGSLICLTLEAVSSN